jgi:hypothetical protein
VNKNTLAGVVGRVSGQAAVKASASRGAQHPLEGGIAGNARVNQKSTVTEPEKVKGLKENP